MTTKLTREDMIAVCAPGQYIGPEGYEPSALGGHSWDRPCPGQHAELRRAENEPLVDWFNEVAKLLRYGSRQEFLDVQDTPQGIAGMRKRMARVYSKAVKSSNG